MLFSRGLRPTSNIHLKGVVGWGGGWWRVGGGKEEIGIMCHKLWLTALAAMVIHRKTTGEVIGKNEVADV